MKPLVFRIDDGSGLKHVVEVGEQQLSTVAAFVDEVIERARDRQAINAEGRAAEEVVSALTYCSFVGEEGFRGAVILRGALDPIQACKACHEKGINPGGEMISFECDESVEGYDWLAANTDRLLTEAELRAIGGKSIGEFDAEEGGAL